MRMLQSMLALVVFLFSSFSFLSAPSAAQDEITVEDDLAVTTISLRTLRVVPMSNGDSMYGASSVVTMKSGGKVALVVYVSGRECAVKPVKMYLTPAGVDSVVAIVNPVPGSAEDRASEAICGAIGKAGEHVRELPRNLM